MTETRVLIVVKDPEAGSAYASALSGLGVTYDIVSSFVEMSCAAVENPYNGLIVDILTLVRSSKEEKVIAYECINIYPVLRVKWENKKKKIGLSPLEESFSPNVDAALQFFIESRCRGFAARPLRKHARRNLHLNLLLSRDCACLEAGTVKTFTVSISQGGLFVHTLEALVPGQTVWLRFVEFSDQTPIAATVRWVLKWGEARSIPGAGLKFERLSESQERDMMRVLN